MHPPGPISFIFIQFVGKIGQRNRLAFPSLGWCPLWEILDPPLVWDQSTTLRDLTFLIAAVRWTGHLTAESVLVPVTDGNRVARTDSVRHDDR